MFLFELKYRCKQVTTYVTAFIAFALTSLFAASFVDHARAGELYLNSPLAIAAIGSFSTLFALLFIGAGSTDAHLRDKTSNMEALVYPTPMRKFAYVIPRMLAVFCMSVTLVVVVNAVTTAGLYALLPDRDLLFMSVSPIHYAKPLLLFVLPNLLVFCLITSGVSILTRNSGAAFFSLVLIFVLTITSMDLLAGGLQKWNLARMLDPTGFTLLKLFRKSLPSNQVAASPVLVDSALLLNRVLWLGLGAFVLGIGFRALEFSYRPVRSGSGLKGSTPSSVEPVLLHPIRLTRTFGLSSAIRQVLSTGMNQYKAIVFHWNFVLLMGAVAVIGHVFDELLEGPLGVPLLPAGFQLTKLFSLPVLELFVLGVICVAAAQLVWREREARLSDLWDNLPVSSSVLFFGKAFALSLFIFTMQTLLLISAITIQVSRGYGVMDLGFLLSYFLGIQFVDYLIFAVATLLIHVLINQKFLALLLSLLFCSYPMFAAQLGLEHHLLIFASDPGLLFSDFDHYGNSILPWVVFKSYWCLVSLTALVLAIALWQRGREESLRRRMHALRLMPQLRFILPVLITMTVVLGGFIYWNTNYLSRYLSSAEEIRSRAGYEQNFKQYETADQPDVDVLDLNLNLFPKSERFELKGRYMMVNRSSHKIKEIYLTLPPALYDVEISFSVQNVLSQAHLSREFRVYQLSEPLQAGDSVSMTFMFAGERKGFENVYQRPMMSGSVFFARHDEILPAIGYQKNLELTAEEDRRRFGLPKRNAFMTLEEATPERRVAREKVRIRTTVVTDAGEVVVAPGEIGSVTGFDNRISYSFDTQKKIFSGFAILSGKYSVYERNHHGKVLQVIHHGAHTHNVEVMMKALQESIDSYTDIFGSYEHQTLRLVEYPGSGALTSFAGMIIYPEDFAQMDPERDLREFNLPFAVVAHEVAHQWWGNQLTPASVEGAPLLTESLAWYSAFGVVEKSFGADHLQRLLEVMHDAYLTPRSKASVPLVRSNDRFLAYRKGPFAMYALRAYAGAEPVDQTLRLLYSRFHGTDTLAPLSTDLVNVLRKQLPDSLQPLVTDLFEVNTYWEMKIKDAVAQHAKDSAWEVSASVEAVKQIVDESGNESAGPFVLDVEVGVYNAEGTMIYQHTHKLHEGQQEIVLQTSEKPESIMIDPRALLIETKRTDNYKALLDL